MPKPQHADDKLQVGVPSCLSSGLHYLKKLMPNISWRTSFTHHSSLAPSKIAYVKPRMIDVLYC